MSSKVTCYSIWGEGYKATGHFDPAALEASVESARAGGAYKIARSAELLVKWNTRGSQVSCLGRRKP